MLRDVDLTVEGGTTVALVGATGSGKSSLVSLLGRNYDVTGGAVLIDGADVREVELNSLRSQIGVVTDDPFLFSATVHDNIAYGRPDATREDVERAAERAQAAGFIAELPDGYDTVVGERGLTLSRRPAPADRDRAGAAHRPADPRARRRDLLGRRLDRAGDQAGAARGDARPHHVRDRPPALHASRWPTTSSCSRTARSPPAARTRSCCARASCTPRSPPRACPDQVFLNRNPIEKVAGL